MLSAEARSLGFFPAPVGPRFNSWSPPLDLTNPAAVTWWRGQLDAYTSMGIEGYKLDFAEDIVPGIGGRATPWGFHDGSTQLTMHARYQTAYHSTYSATPL